MDELQVTELTGTLSFKAGSTTILGNETVFTKQLHVGQKVFAEQAEWVLVVRKVEDDTHLTAWRAPDATVENVSAFCMPSLFVRQPV